MDRAYAPQTDLQPETQTDLPAAAPTTTGWGNQDTAATLHTAPRAAPTTCGPQADGWYDALLASPQATARALLFGPYLGNLDGYRAMMDEARNLAAADASSADPDRASAAAALPDHLLVSEMSLSIPGALGPTEWAALSAGLDNPATAAATASFVDAFYGEAAGDVLGDVDAHRAATTPAADQDESFLSQWGSAIASEGPHAILHPEDGIDEMHTRTELASRFQIVDEDHTGQAPNALTQDQYDEVVRLYSDVRMGNTSLGFDTSGLDPKAAAAFKSGTMDDIADLLQTPAGRQVVGDLAGADPEFDRTWISPAADPKMAVTKRDFQAGKSMWDGKSWIEYAPGVDLDQGSGLAWDDQRSDVVLMHEMTHAWYNQGPEDEILTGDRKVANEFDTTGRDRGWIGKMTVTNAEYQAVGLGPWADASISENAYREQRNELAGQPGAMDRDGDLAQRDSYMTESIGHYMNKPDF